MKARRFIESLCFKIEVYIHFYRAFRTGREQVQIKKRQVTFFLNAAGYKLKPFPFFPDHPDQNNNRFGFNQNSFNFFPNSPVQNRARFCFKPNRFDFKQNSFNFFPNFPPPKQNRIQFQTERTGFQTEPTHPLTNLIHIFGEPGFV